MKSHHVFLAIVVAFAVPITIHSLRKHAAEKAADERVELDREIAPYYDRTVKPALASTVGEPERISGPVLPIVPGDDTAATHLDREVYGYLDAGLRTDHLTGATTIVVIEHTSTAYYAGAGVAGGSISPVATFTLFDVGSGRVVGRKQIKLEEPPEEATDKMLDDYRDRMAGTIAANLNALPRAK